MDLFLTEKMKKIESWDNVCSHLQVEISLLTLYLVSIFGSILQIGHN